MICLCAAPEILANSRHYDGHAADIWSAGVMLFVSLLTLPPPFYSQAWFWVILINLSAVKCKRRSVKIEWDMWLCMRLVAADLVKMSHCFCQPVSCTTACIYLCHILDTVSWSGSWGKLHLQVMLFCEYPFERPEDAKDHRRFTIVLERVLNVQYKIPDGKTCSYCASTIFNSELPGASCQRQSWYLISCW